MPCWSHRSETGTCSRRWNRRMATFSWAVNRLRVFLGMGEPPLEIVAYSSGPFFPFRLKQDTLGSHAGFPVRLSARRDCLRSQMLVAPFLAALSVPGTARDTQT